MSKESHEIPELNKIIVVLGPDRVGKSTYTKALQQAFQTEGVSTRILHFDGPKPYHDSPVQMYLEPLDEIIATVKHSRPEVVICDRGFSEVCFYDKFRRQVYTSEQWALHAESVFSSHCKSLDVFLIKREWDWVKPHHRKEIDEIHPYATNYFKSMQLQNRMNEHHEYYEYMEDYLQNRSSLDYKVISPASAPAGLV